MIVVDTHALIWVVDGDARLGRVAHAGIEGAGRTDGIAVLAITPWEIVLLPEKGRLRLGCDAAVWIDTALDLLRIGSRRLVKDRSAPHYSLHATWPWM